MSQPKSCYTITQKCREFTDTYAKAHVSVQNGGIFPQHLTDVSMALCIAGNVVSELNQDEAGKCVKAFQGETLKAFQETLKPVMTTIKDSHHNPKHPAIALGHPHGYAIKDSHHSPKHPALYIETGGLKHYINQSEHAHVSHAHTHPIHEHEHEQDRHGHEKYMHAHKHGYPHPAIKDGHPQAHEHDNSFMY